MTHDYNTTDVTTAASIPGRAQPSTTPGIYSRSFGKIKQNLYNDMHRRRFPAAVHIV